MSARRSDDAVTVAAVEIAEVTGRMAGGQAGNSKREWRARTGLCLTVRAEDGRIGFGEASPLPGYSPDTLAGCQRVLADMAWAGVTVRSVADIENICLAMGARLAPPAARFAAETALLHLLGQVQGRSIADLLAEYMDLPVHARAELCALVSDPFARPLDGPDALDDIGAAWARGLRCVKIKIGRPGRFADELAFVRAVRGRYPHGLAIRLDVNRAWTQAQAEARLRLLAEVGPEYVEEPCVSWPQLGQSPVPLAADESLSDADADTLDDFLATGMLAAVILKPMVLGGLVPSVRLARRARAAGVVAVPSHLFDGPIAMNAYTALASLTGGTCGLDRHAGLAVWPDRSIPELRAGYIEATATRGRLSIHRAAERHGDAPFVIHPGGVSSYRDVARRVAELARDESGPRDRAVLIAERGIDCIVGILHNMHNGTPVILVHARATADERTRAVALADTLPAGTDADLVLFTSGSSGRPKGVVIDRSALIASADASASHLGWRDDDRWLCCLPLAHIGGLSIVIRCLLAGSTVVLTPEGSFDPDAVAATIADQRVTLLSLVPTMLARLLDTDWTPPAHLRAVLIGGAATPHALVHRAHERGVPALVTYGMTEMCSQIATQKPANQGRANQGRKSVRPSVQEAGHIGPLLPGVDAEIRAGRLWVRGPSMCRGYLGADAHDHARFDERGYFDTGDRGYLDTAGELHILGRADDTIITGGENVDPQEVENVLCSHPDIAAACVFGVPDSTWGQVVAAAVVGVDDTSVTDAQLADFLSERLAPHKRPRRLCQLPALAAGDQLKVRRRQVAALAEPRLQPLHYRSS